MLRTDLMLVGDDSNDESIAFGLVVLPSSGAAVYCEGDSATANEYLEEDQPGPDGVGIPAANGKAFLEALSRRAWARSYFTEPYDDADSLYDLNTGRFTGNADNPPLPDESTAVQ